MATISLGKVAFTWRGAFSATADYSAQDVVSYEGTAYVCTAPITGTTSTNPKQDVNNFDVFAQGIDGVTANVGDIVYFNGNTLVPLSIGATGQVLKVDTNGLPIWDDNPVRRGTRVSALTKTAGGSPSYRRNFAIMEDGSVRAWGRGDNYMLGQGATVADRSYPGRVAFPSGAGRITKVIPTYDKSVLAIDENGKLWGWGLNDLGELGTGDTVSQYVPYEITGNASNSLYGKTVVDAWTGTDNTAEPSWHVLTSDGNIHSCGDNDVGQLGMGDTNTRYNYSEVPVISNITDFAAGAQNAKHCLALNDSGVVYAWGYNAQGQLGLGNTTQMNIPMQITYFSSNLITVRDVGAEYNASWAIDTDNNLYTWGINNYGQLGNGTTTNGTSPSLVMTNVSKCFMQGGNLTSTFVIKTDGSVWSTGYGAYGSLGNDAANTGNLSSFAECKIGGTASFTNAVEVIGNGSNAFIRTADGKVYAAGYSGNGNLGIGIVQNNNFWFTEIPIHRRLVTDIAFAGTTTEGGVLMLLDDGQALQTGYAGESQLPEDDDELSPVPYPIIF
jgi:alpha-tubulin suppressor-like RCC1 family protein